MTAAGRADPEDRIYVDLQATAPGPIPPWS
jgi:hypothetical protein